MPEEHLTSKPRIAYRTDPWTIQITDDIDVLLVMRSYGEKWDTEREKQAKKAHDGIYNFLADCVKYKKEVYACIKKAKHFELPEDKS